MVDDKRTDQQQKKRRAAGTDILRNELSIPAPSGSGLSIPG